MELNVPFLLYANCFTKDVILCYILKVNMKKFVFNYNSKIYFNLIIDILYFLS